MLKRSGSLALGVIALVSLTAGSAMAQSKCQGAKIKAAGKRASCLLGVDSKAASKNLPADPTKIQKCVDKYTAAFTKAETGTTCTTPGDTTTIANKIDAFVTDANSELAVSPPSKCQSAKIKAAGKKASCLLGVYSKAVTKALAADPAKLQKCVDKYTAAFVKADTGTTCSTTSGDTAEIEDKVDAFVDDVLCELDTTATCDCGGSSPEPAFLSFTTGVGSGNCGNGLNDSGTSLKTLACNLLYVGGGGSATPPDQIPDYGTTLTRTTCCRHKFVKLEAATSAQTGSDRNCSDTNCKYGPPLPIISGASTCVINRVAQPAEGHAYCDAGSQLLDIPLLSDVYLTIDALPSRCNSSATGAFVGRKCTSNSDCPGGSCVTDPTVQPCPICNTSTLVCNGGPNDGLPCTPGTQLVVGPQWPTSHDCPPTGAPLGTLPIPYLLSTGTSHKTAIDQGTQNRVFCAFCGDPASATFRNPATSCHSDADCAGFPGFTACKQRTGGAFAVAGIRTIVENGSPAGPLTIGGPAGASTLSTVFCIPPTFNGVIDAVGDLPGPGATALQGSTQLLP